MGLLEICIVAAIIYWLGKKTRRMEEKAELRELRQEVKKLRKRKNLTKAKKRMNSVHKEETCNIV